MTETSGVDTLSWIRTLRANAVQVAYLDGLTGDDTLYKTAEILSLNALPVVIYIPEYAVF